MSVKDKVNDLFNMSGSKRRSRLGLGVAKWEAEPWYVRTLLARFTSAHSLPDKFVRDVADDLEGGWFKRNDVFLLQRNGKKALAMRSVDDLSEEQRDQLDQRREWNQQQRSVENLLDLFPSFKYSYSSLLPQAHRSGFVDLVVSDRGKARVVDVARSHSVWIDPVDAPKELYKHRLRINRVIKWAYKNNFVPVMMTLTTYHRWNPLLPLVHLLCAAWRDLLSGSPGRRRASSVGLQGWLRRLEITINDGLINDDGDPLPNSGWHPHFHALLIIPRDKLETLSDAEEEWRQVWVSSVCKRYEAEFGEAIDETFLPAFRHHGLTFSRVYDVAPEKCGSLREVDTGDYFAKIMGYDPVEIYGGDKELTAATLKNSKIPFDLIRDPSLTAADVDLWCEYAIATKGLRAFKLSRDLGKKVDAYFEEHPDDDSRKVCPAESVVASLGRDVYHLLYRNFKLKELYQKISEGYESLCAWLEEIFISLGVPELCACPIAMPRPPARTAEGKSSQFFPPPD